MSLQPQVSFYLSVVLLFVTIGEANAQKAPEKPVFRTSAQMVLVPVTVTDHSGKTVEGLRADDFKILDNNGSQKIVSFSSDDAPCSVGLILDISGSMQQSLNGTKEIAEAFFGTANLEDEFLLLTVSTQPAATAGFTSDTAALEESIDLAQPGGMTALIDTVYLGLSRMREAQLPRRALLILSDGMDNHSRYSESDLMRVALEADVQIYTIAIDNGSASVSTGKAPYRPSLVTKPWDRAEERQGPEMLRKLSDETGGLYFRAGTIAEAKEAVIKAGRTLREEYMIGYHPPNSDSSGKWHRISCQIERIQGECSRSHGILLVLG
ncbi:MAG TPA: VWA domain-containing protein [Candidatus Binatia bacterium]|nr:VWA domain-containing protein [Candidatus Binatia bacterium]